MKIALYQGRFPVAAISENCKTILEFSKQAAKDKKDLVIFPECAITGYAPEDLLFQEDFKNSLNAALSSLQKNLPPELAVVVGSPFYEGGEIFNGIFVFFQGRCLMHYPKQALPNYDVFDEKRYFSAGQMPGYFKFKGWKCGILLCEDLWDRAVVKRLPKHLDLVITIHASPFEKGKRQRRLEKMQYLAQHTKALCIYAHQVGAQDEIIFDGGSFVVDGRGQLLGALPSFEVLGAMMEVSKSWLRPLKVQRDAQWRSGFEEEDVGFLYRALVFALREYIHKNGAQGVLIGLSGGIDSALVLAIAVDALGAEAVEAVLMPSRFTQDMSLEDAQALVEALNVTPRTLSIEPLFKSALKSLKPHFETKAWDITEENLQARLRALFLMALSNKSGKMVLSTTNKSEMAVGYGTLYGDMAGGFAVLKDVYKTEVYALARYRNKHKPIIPERILTRAPSAELKENQTDQDSLPPYDRLDAIIKYYVEDHLGEASIVSKGFLKTEVTQVLQLLKKSEYKRAQAPIGPKLSARAFGKDWRMPVTRV